jgi:hypothetical protein
VLGINTNNSIKVSRIIWLCNTVCGFTCKRFDTTEWSEVPCRIENRSVVGETIAFSSITEHSNVAVCGFE